MTTYYVSTTGNNSANGGSGTPWKTISHAMPQNLKPGDTVIVRSGTYNESLIYHQGRLGGRATSPSSRKCRAGR